jgi:hypothetical protein
MILPGSYTNGFAPRDGQPLYPELWRGCVGAWNPGLGPSGLTLRDNSGYGQHGTLTNMDAAGDWVPSDGRYALDFDGTNDYVDYGVRPNIYGLSRFSCSFWIYKTANSAGWVLNRYNTSAAGGTVGDYFGVTAGTSMPRVIAEFTGTTVSDYAAFQSADVITLNEWHHVAFSVDLTTRANTTITVDGVAKAVTITTGGTPPTGFKAQTSTPWTSSRIVTSGGSPVYSAFIADDIMLFHDFMNYGSHRLLSSRRGISYELAPRRRSRVSVLASMRYNIFTGNVGSLEVIGAS